jgi:hypothetical protein
MNAHPACYGGMGAPAYVFRGGYKVMGALAGVFSVITQILGLLINLS